MFQPSVRHIILPFVLSAAAAAQANDSTGFVETGGITYLKNPHIEMLREDLYISQQQIRVAYLFKNNSAQDITETVLFPLPEVAEIYEGDFANTKDLIDSFRIWADGKAVKPQAHVRAFFQTKDDKRVDLTAELKKCGLTDSELMNPWTQKYNLNKLSDKVQACLAPQADKFNLNVNNDNNGLDYIWSSQIVYSWKQTFKAGKTTEIKHQYAPLVGGSFFSPSEAKKGRPMAEDYCINDDLRRTLGDSDSTTHVYSQLGYILTTGANWARPIGKFTLTVERKPGQLVSLCWDKSLRKIGPNTFRAEKTNFLPKKDLDIIFFTKLQKE
ncbi:MAG: DUF4424 family protein [Neisseria sp.]|nr:DUF4424 family protein [Neisseria sp.]